MNKDEKIEAQQKRLAIARQENSALLGKYDALQTYMKSWMAVQFDNTAFIGEDLLGGVAGIAAYHGASALYGWLAKPGKDGKTGTLAKYPWISDAAQLALSAGLYAANLTVQRNSGEPLSQLREMGRRATATQALLSLDSLLKRGYRAIEAYSAKKQLEDAAK